MIVRLSSLPQQYARSTLLFDQASKPRTLFALNARFFHATSRRHLVEECLFPVHTLMTNFHHATGLPWAATIPLTALVARVILSSPFEFYSHRIFQKQPIMIKPFNEAEFEVERKIAKAYPGKNALEKQRLVSINMEGVFRKLQDEHGLQQWRKKLRYARNPPLADDDGDTPAYDWDGRRDARLSLEIVWWTQ